MSIYKADFVGKRRGALGVDTHFIVTDIEAADFEAARVKLYDHFEHLHSINITEGIQRNTFTDTETMSMKDLT